MRRIIREEEPPKPSTRLSTLGRPLAAVSPQPRHASRRRLTRLVRGELDWIVMKALEKDRNRRYESANALRRRRAALPGRRAGAGVPAVGGVPLRKFARRNKRRWRPPAGRGGAGGGAGAGRELRPDQLGVGSRDKGRSRPREALKSERQAKEDLATALYYQRIASAAHAREKNRNGRAEEMLDLCPDRFRGWEWHYLKRLPFADFPTLSHEETVIRVAYSPDGRLLASGSLDGVVKTWDARNGEESVYLRPPAHRRLVHGLVFSPDSQFLATGGEDDRVKLWNPWTGQPVGEFRTGSRVLIALAVSPDGRQLATAFQDRLLSLWDVSSRRQPGPSRTTRWCSTAWPSAPTAIASSA